MLKPKAVYFITGLIVFKLHQICELLLLRAVIRYEGEKPWDSPEIMHWWEIMQGFLRKAEETFDWRKDGIQTDEMSQVMSCLTRHRTKTTFPTCLQPKHIRANLYGLKDDPTIHRPQDSPKELLVDVYRRFGTFYPPPETDSDFSVLGKPVLAKLEKFYKMMQRVG